MHVARDSFYKMGAGNFHDQLIPNQPQEKSSMTLSFERRVDLQNGVYKMGWPNPTYPQNQVDIHFILRTTPPILEGGYFWCLIWLSKSYLPKKIIYGISCWFILV